MVHPADIAEEVRSWPFFLHFDGDLLFQVCTLIKTVSFSAGEFLLHEGKNNNCLYFLRSGIVDVLVEGERVFQFSKVGEVMGEMSAISGKQVSATLRAVTPIECFVVQAEDFQHVPPNKVDRFQFLLYKIYSILLTERLIRTNEKAKQFEIMARELAQAKRNLEAVTSAKMEMLLHEVRKSKTKESILLIDPNKKSQSMIKSAVAGTGVQLQIVDCAEKAAEILQNGKIDLILLDAEQAEKFPPSPVPTVLICSSEVNFEKVAGLEHQTLITKNLEDRSMTVKSTLVTILKILKEDFFGAEKYLSWGVELQSRKVTRSDQRETLREEILTSFRAIGIRSALLDRVQVPIEELLMNCIYDAPVDSKGISRYNHLPRTTKVELLDEETAEIRFGSDGVFLAVSVADPFGGLKRDTLLKYLHSCYSAKAGEFQFAKGGAGRGFHQIVESADLTIFNVEEGKKTEIICLWNLVPTETARPSIHFFFR